MKCMKDIFVEQIATVPTGFFFVCFFWLEDLKGHSVGKLERSSLHADT